MRIYDVNSDKKIKKVIIYLTIQEAKEMRDSLESLIINNEKNIHEHIPDREDDFNREITVCLYRKDNLSSFDERSKKLILEDK